MVQSVVFLVPSTRLSGLALAGGIALVNTFGLLGGFLGPSVMGLIEQARGSTRNGLLLMAGLLVLAAGLSQCLLAGGALALSRQASPPWHPVGTGPRLGSVA